MKVEPWTCGGGDLPAAVGVFASRNERGALLTVAIARRVPESAEVDPSRVREPDVLRRVWETVVADLPVETVGRRSLWLRFDFVLRGDRGRLTRDAAKLLTSLTADDALREFVVHLILTEIRPDDPERTLFCDPGYALAASSNDSIVAWVEPYPGPDWRASGRYPTVTVIPAVGMMP